MFTMKNTLLLAALSGVVYSHHQPIGLEDAKDCGSLYTRCMNTGKDEYSCTTAKTLCTTCWTNDSACRSAYSTSGSVNVCDTQITQCVNSAFSMLTQHEDDIPPATPPAGYPVAPTNTEYPTTPSDHLVNGCVYEDQVNCAAKYDKCRGEKIEISACDAANSLCTQCQDADNKCRTIGERNMSFCSSQLLKCVDGAWPQYMCKDVPPAPTPSAPTSTGYGEATPAYTPPAVSPGYGAPNQTWNNNVSSITPANFVTTNGASSSRLSLFGFYVAVAAMIPFLA